ncbi:MAG: hypothetical protein OHK0031_19400 [Anaerolineales bacterium]
MKKLQLRSPSAWTMFIFGALAILLGLVGIIRPEWTLALVGFSVSEAAARLPGDYTLVFVTASSMASFNMGVYYVLAAFANWQDFFRWTVPFRVLTFSVFSLAVLRGIAPAGFLGVAVWELTGALLTGLALWQERRKHGN